MYPQSPLLSSHLSTPIDSLLSYLISIIYKPLLIMALMISPISQNINLLIIAQLGSFNYK